MPRPLTLRSTHLAVILSLSIIAGNDLKRQLVILPLANLTPLFVTVWSFWQWVDRLGIEVAYFAARLIFSVEMNYDRLIAWLTLALILTLAVGWGLAGNTGRKFWRKIILKARAKNERFE